jgi:hypothetical protein
MSFTFKPRPDDRPATAARTEVDRSSTSSESLSPVEQPPHSELFTSRPATVWPYAAPDKSFDLDAWKAESQASRPPSYSDHVSFNRGAAAFTQMKDLEALHASVRRPESEHLRHFGGGLDRRVVDAGQFGGPPLAMSAYPANFPSARLLHHRVASASSALSGDDRFMLPSDPGSDFSSDYSDTFQSSFAVPHALPFEPQYESPVRPGCANVSPAALPDYVVEEIRRLKLENMALRRMASEVVRISAGSGSLDGQADSDRTTPVCSQHPPLTSAPRLQSVLQGADPLRIYSGAADPTTPEILADRKQRSGTAASMWAPNRGAFEGAGASTGVKPAQPGSVAFDHGRASSRASPAVPGLREDAGVYDGAPAAVPAHPRTQALSKGSPSSSSGSAPRSPSRLENAPAGRLVAMILDRRGQEASMVLQQQLKTGAPERQTEILDAIRTNVVALSHDRHGNFLVQGAIESRADLALDLKGSFVELTMSQFGCHVVQKALEGGEEVREAVVQELLGSRLDQTLTSRHSIHVWQRILESEWQRSSFRDEIFASINRQLKGHWARTARQEAGSIICQNIFESAQPDEKARCMQEVLDELEECATNQWGVWVVQHIIEHGSPEERHAALQRVSRSASKLTLSQYGKFDSSVASKRFPSDLLLFCVWTLAGQKAVMSGLKTGDAEFLHDYVDVMCQSSQPRRPPLIDVCLAPHGIQIVTQLLTTVEPRTRERIISTVRRNSVFLKGSKAGMKVHQLCERARAFAGY